MDLKHLVMLVLQLSILATVFTFGLRATTADMLHLVRRPGLLARSIVAMFVIMPVLAVVLVRGFEFTPAVEVELLALAIAPIPPMLPRRETKAGGEGAYGIALMATIGLLSILIVPLAVWVLGTYFDRDIAMPFSTIALIVGKSIVAPLLAGMIVHAFFPKVAERIAGPVGIAAFVILIAAALVIFFANVQAIWAVIGSGNVLALAIFIIVGLLVGHFLGGPDPESRIVLALSTACRHPAVAFAIASAGAPGERFGGAILLYLLLSLVVAIPYLKWVRRKVPQAAPAKS
jgi:BASS family bile acid:Na+ symporter